MDRDRLKKLAREKRFIPGIYNYCDRWCERCPQTSRCLNFSISEEEFSDPESRDILNEAFWKTMTKMMHETMELLKESAKEWGVDLETLDTDEGREDLKAKREATENHLLCRAARKYSMQVEEWFKGTETLFLETTAAREGVSLEEAIEVIRWYQYFICAKVMRAVGGKIEDNDEGDDEFSSDSDGSAKIALIALDRSIAAWAMIRHWMDEGEEEVVDIITFLDGLREAVEKTFPKARAFVRPGFDTVDGKG